MASTGNHGDHAGPDQSAIPPLPALTPHSPGISVERDAAGRAVGIRHPTRPYAVRRPADDNGLFAAAGAYVKAAASILVLPDAWIEALNKPPTTPGVAAKPASKAALQIAIEPRWLPVDGSDPRCSAWLDRRPAKGNKPKYLDRTMVMVASLALVWNRAWIPLHGGQGLRVTAHVDEARGVVRFTSIGHTLPPWSKELAEISTRAPSNALVRAAAALAPSAVINVVVESMRSAFALGDNVDQSSVGARLLPGELIPGLPNFETLSTTTPAPDLCYALTARAVHEAGSLSLEAVDKTPLAAFANPVYVDVFEQDPPSATGEPIKRRSYRKHELFDNSRVTRALWNPSASSSASRVVLADTNNLVKVMSSRIAKDNPAMAVMEVPKQVLAHSRTNMQAAVNAYHLASELFKRLDRYGFDIAKYFAFVDLPLEIQYRGAILPGASDGQTINAQVRWRITAKSGSQPARGVLDVSFALADLRLNPRLQPLGMACDARFSWHEYSHVLLAAATGSLEFRFAHSAGDALAAILADPASNLASDAGWRGQTFPWITQANRRHDREPAAGWSWTGSLYRREREFAHGLCDKNGYWAEQMLASSLFRVYRSIGGDAQRASGKANVAAREAAADYCAFLIMKAIRLGGPDAVTPVSRPDTFVTALINADIGTEGLAALPESGHHAHAGGTVHKVIRWAFEQQGLYPDPAAPIPHDGPGRADAQDIFIDDGRRGEYTPITYRDDWHALPSALWVRRHADAGAADQKPRAQRINHVYVRVGNRGYSLADNVSVTVYYASLSAGAVPPWPDAAWKPVPAASAQVLPIQAGGEVTFGSFTWTVPAGIRRYALLAVATCLGDRANVDAAALLPCAAVPSPLVSRLVACDNNIGVRVVKSQP